MAHPHAAEPANEHALRLATESFYTAVDKHDVGGILAVLHPDVDWWIFGPQGNIINGHYKGHKDVGRFFQNLNSVFTVTHFQFREMHIAGHSRFVTALGKEEGTVNAMKHSAKFDEDWAGKPFHNRWVHMFWFDEHGKVIKFRANFTQFDQDFPYDSQRK